MTLRPRVVLRLQRSEVDRDINGSGRRNASLNRVFIGPSGHAAYPCYPHYLQVCQIAGIPVVCLSAESECKPRSAVRPDLEWVRADRVW